MIGETVEQVLLHNRGTLGFGPAGKAFWRGRRDGIPCRVRAAPVIPLMGEPGAGWRHVQGFMRSLVEFAGFAEVDLAAVSILALGAGGHSVRLLLGLDRLRTRGHHQAPAAGDVLLRIIALLGAVLHAHDQASTLAMRRMPPSSIIWT